MYLSEENLYVELENSIFTTWCDGVRCIYMCLQCTVHLRVHGMSGCWQNPWDVVLFPLTDSTQACYSLCTTAPNKGDARIHSVKVGVYSTLYFLRSERTSKDTYFLVFFFFLPAYKCTSNGITSLIVKLTCCTFQSNVSVSFQNVLRLQECKKCLLFSSVFADRVANCQYLS